MSTFIGVLLLIGVYFLPSIVALARHHNNGAPIILLNMFAGWTVVCWFAALIWALTDNVRRA